MVSTQPPPSAPGGPGRPGSSTRRRGRALLPTLVTLFVLLVALLLFVGFYTDWLWFQSVGYTSVFTKRVLLQLLLFLLFGGAVGGFVVLNTWLAYRSRPAFRSISLEQNSLDRYRLTIEPFRKVLLVGLGVVFGLFAGMSAAGAWRGFLLWQNSTAFGTTDPQFGVDVSFYAFRLPWWHFLVATAMAAVMVALAVTAVVHYLYGGIRFQSPGSRLTSAARRHLSVLAGLFILLKAVAYYLNRFDLVVREGSLLTGATYTDVHAVLPAKNILVVVAIVIAAIFFANAFRDMHMLPVLGLGLLVVTSVVIGGIYPAVIQQLTVKPTEQVKEQPYIQRNIDETRSAYRLDGVKTQSGYDPKTAPQPSAVAKSSGTLENIRIMDPAVIAPTFDQLQQIRGYYRFPDPLDVDRYTLGGKEVGVVVAPRELYLSGINESQRNWINLHLVYTHGYGLVAAYGNKELAGAPDFIEKNIPPSGQLDITQPRVYFGEEIPTYSIVGGPAGSQAIELDYPDASSSGQANTTYKGSGGVPIGSFLNRLVYAVKFREGNFMLSDLINSDSRILYIRSPKERIAQVAPWLTLDNDPYATVVDGRLVWIVDGYTTTDNYPYSQRTSLSTATADTLTTTTTTLATPRPTDQINYMRNSVKAVVDAYDGTVTLYAWDESDPVLQTWEKAFPGTVEPRSAISQALLAHLRYPEDLFKVQRSIYAHYHVTDASSFYSGQDFWRVPTDPTATNSQSTYQPPYYLTLQMPGEKGLHFSLTTTFSPNKRDTLSAFMAIDSDTASPDFGTMRVLQLTNDTSFPGPNQMQNNFESDPAVSTQLSLLRQGGSKVQLGNLLTLPVAGGLLYVEPVYVRASSGSSYPLLRKMLVSFGDKIAFEDTLGAGLADVLRSSGGTGGGTNTGTAQQQLTRAIADALAAYEDGQAALKRGDFAAYGEAQTRLEDALRRAQAAAAKLGVPAPTVPGATPTPTPSGSATPTPQPTPSVTVPASAPGP